jgi:hypothetical protein
MWPKQSECDEFYGNPRGPYSYNTTWARLNLVHVMCPWALRMGAIHVPFITIHKKCEEALSAALAEIWEGCGRSEAEINRLGYDVFSGSFNYRPMRTVERLSMHAYGAAIDWDAPQNEQGERTHLFTEESILVQAFKKQGAVWGGAWEGESVDAMHIQFAVVD